MVAGEDRGTLGGDVLHALDPRPEEQPQHGPSTMRLEHPVEQPQPTSLPPSTTVRTPLTRCTLRHYARTARRARMSAADGRDDDGAARGDPAARRRAVRPRRRPHRRAAVPRLHRARRRACVPGASTSPTPAHRARSPGCPGHGTRGRRRTAPAGRTGTPRSSSAFGALRARCDAGRSWRAVDGRDAGAPAGRGARRRDRRAGPGQPALLTKRKDRLAAAGAASTLGPLVPGDRQRHQEARRHRAGLRPAAAQGRHSQIASSGLDHPADLAEVTQPVLLLRSPRTTSSSRRQLGACCWRGSPASDVTEVLLEDSYHVATLDNDAPTIFAESADFIERVTR